MLAKPVTLTVLIEKDLAQTAKKLAQQQGTSLSIIVRKALKQFVGASSPENDPSSRPATRGTRRSKTSRQS
jgi:predicted transcriptional regulator